jgi:hypothetical protein
MFEVNDQGEFGIIFIFDDHWPHIDQELHIFMIDDDKPKRWVFQACEIVRCRENRKLLAVMRSVRQPRFTIKFSKDIEFLICTRNED